MLTSQVPLRASSSQATCYFKKPQTLALPFAASERLGKSSVSKFLSKSPFFFPVQKYKTTDGNDCQYIDR